ncbi:MAG: hypothetical protein Q7U40_05450 [Desulfatirhabdiaceae bacterium]|nr:hypothetical protein [Desulfatirhabdiaceae bacterium]
MDTVLVVEPFEKRAAGEVVKDAVNTTDSPGLANDLPNWSYNCAEIVEGVILSALTEGGATDSTKLSRIGVGVGVGVGVGMGAAVKVTATLLLIIVPEEVVHVTIATPALVEVRVTSALPVVFEIAVVLDKLPLVVANVRPTPCSGVGPLETVAVITEAVTPSATRDAGTAVRAIVSAASSRSGTAICMDRTHIKTNNPAIGVLRIIFMVFLRSPSKRNASQTDTSV